MLAMRVLIGRSAMIDSDVTVEDSVRIMTGAYIASDTFIESDVFVGPMAVIMNDRYMSMWKDKTYRGPTILSRASIGAGACLLAGITVEEEVVVAMGAVVVSNVSTRRLFAGVPARDIGEARKD